MYLYLRNEWYNENIARLKLIIIILLLQDKIVTEYCKIWILQNIAFSHMVVVSLTFYWKVTSITREYLRAVSSLESSQKYRRRVPSLSATLAP